MGSSRTVLDLGTARGQKIAALALALNTAGLGLGLEAAFILVPSVLGESESVGGSG